MTEQELRKSVVAIMQGWIGCKEANGSHKKIIDIYNAHKPLARGYAVKYTDEWCATTVSAAFIKAGLTSIAPTECSCAKMIELYQKIGRWKEDDNYKPQAGDVIMYDWQDSGKGDNRGNPDHVGIVASVSGSTIKVIEGNKSEAVAYRTIQVGGKYIRGYCLPDYASKATATTQAGKEPSATTDKSDTKNPSGANHTAYNVKPDPAKRFLEYYAKSYKVTASRLNMRRGAGTTKGIIKTLNKGDTVRCYGYYTQIGATIWLLVVDSTGAGGYCSKKFLA